MLLIYPDTNALLGDALMRKDISKKLLSHVAAGRCELHLSPVVVGELDRRLKDSLDAQHGQSRTRIDKTAEEYQLSGAEVVAALQRFYTEAKDQIRHRRDELTSMSGFFADPWPDTTVEKVVGRELARKRPFEERYKGNADGRGEKIGTIGHRDTIIWLGAIELAARRPDGTVLLVTMDNGFLIKSGPTKQLHADLLADLQENNIDSNRVQWLPDLSSVVIELDKQAEASVTTETEEQVHANEIFATMRAAIRYALHEYNEELSRLQWGHDEFDPHDGGYLEPEIDARLPREMESVYVSNLESTFDVSMQPDPPNIDEPIRCTYQVTIDFDGVMEKAAWYSGEYPEIELWDAEHNDHYVGVQAHRVLELTVEVTYDSEAETAHVDGILDSRVTSEEY